MEKRKITDIVSDIKSLIKESVLGSENIIKSGCFVEYLNDEWHVDDINGQVAIISNPDGKIKKVNLSDISYLSKKIEDKDFVDMPMENSFENFTLNEAKN